MKEIHFSCPYEKLKGQKTAVLLLSVYMYLDEDGNKAFLDYDTEGVYKIDPNEGAVIFLLFLGSDDIPFTTIRKANDENERKYFDSEGEVFKIVIDGKEETK